MLLLLVLVIVIPLLNKLVAHNHVALNFNPSFVNASSFGCNSTMVIFGLI
jgi:hypothetical protein